MKNIYWRTCYWTVFTKWLFGTLFLDSRFQNYPDSVISQKYQSLSNQSFKYNSPHMPFLYLTLTLSFEQRFCVFITNGYYTRSKPSWAPCYLTGQKNLIVNYVIDLTNYSTYKVFWPGMWTANLFIYKALRDL